MSWKKEKIAKKLQLCLQQQDSPRRSAEIKGYFSCHNCVSKKTEQTAAATSCHLNGESACCCESTLLARKVMSHTWYTYLQQSCTGAFSDRKKRVVQTWVNLLETLTSYGLMSLVHTHLCAYVYTEQKKTVIIFCVNLCHLKNVPVWD